MRGLLVLLLLGSLGAGPAVRGGPLRKPADAAAARDEKVALSLLNEARAAAGLAPVTLDPAMSEACRLHAEYLEKNHGRREVAGLKAHHEQEHLPGYTPEGAKAGKASDIAFVSLPEAVGQFVNSLYHRTPILRPSLKRVGMASVAGPAGPITLVMFDSPAGADDGAGYPVVYPANGQTNVPLSFVGEIPNPVPEGEPVSGSPITIDFGERSVTGVTAQLRDGTGAEVPIWLSSPEKPASRTFPQGGVVCLLAKRPLRPFTMYRATVKATVGGVAQTRDWKFTTMSPVRIDARDLAAVRGGVGRLVTLSGNVQHTGRIDGHSFLQIGGEGDALVSVLVPDLSLPETLKATGMSGLDAFNGQRVEAIGVLEKTGSYFNVKAYSAADLKVLAVDLPVIDAVGPHAFASTGKLVRVRGRVKQTGTSPGWVYLVLGESNGKPVSAFVREAVWTKSGLALAAVEGRTVTVQGVLRLDGGEYLNVNVERPEQLEWAK